MEWALLKGRHYSGLIDELAMGGDFGWRLLWQLKPEGVDEHLKFLLLIRA